MIWESLLLGLAFLLTGVHLVRLRRQTHLWRKLAPLCFLGALACVANDPFHRSPQWLYYDTFGKQPSLAIHNLEGELSGWGDFYDCVLEFDTDPITFTKLCEELNVRKEAGHYNYILPRHQRTGIWGQSFLPDTASVTYSPHQGHARFHWAFYD
ncbi:MAG: hypothetical protein NTX57_21780 [Armatimonadetes bacterium]|nr:hypothetical protein [Armatimonadota bacterium]